MEAYRRVEVAEVKTGCLKEVLAKVKVNLASKKKKRDAEVGKAKMKLVNVERRPGRRLWWCTRL